MLPVHMGAPAQSGMSSAQVCTSMRTTSVHPSQTSIVHCLGATGCLPWLGQDVGLACHAGIYVEGSQFASSIRQPDAQNGVLL